PASGAFSQNDPMLTEWRAPAGRSGVFCVRRARFAPLRRRPARASRRPLALQSAFRSLFASRDCMMDRTRSCPRRDENPMNADELIALNEQIAGMARAGLPLDQGLSSLAKEMGRGRLRRVTESIASDLRDGATLPEAVARRQKELPPYYANLITAGVRTGRLPEVLATLTTYARTVAVTRTIVVDSL